MPPRDRTIRRRPSLRRVVRARPRLFLSLAVGAVVVAVLVVSTDWWPTTRLLIAWDVAIALYLALVADVMARSDVQRIRSQAALEDEGQSAILVLTVAAALASLAAIFPQLASSAAAAGTRRPPHVILAIVTILLSWTFVHTGTSSTSLSSSA